MIELKSLKTAQPDLASAIDMQIALLDMQRRVQSRVPLPWIETDAAWLRSQYAAGRAVVRFADIPIDWSDFRLTLRQTTDILRRFDALEPDDHRAIVELGRDSGFEPLVKRWYEATSGVNGDDPKVRAHDDAPAGLDQVLVLALRPFLARCAEVLMQRTDLPPWTHGHCPYCGWEPDFSVITRAAERRLDLRPLPGAVGLRRDHLPVLRERRPLAHHVVRHARRPLPRLRLQCLPPVLEGVRRTKRDAAGHGRRRHDRDAAARRGGHSARLRWMNWTEAAESSTRRIQTADSKSC